MISQPIRLNHMASACRAAARQACLIILVLGSLLAPLLIWGCDRTPSTPGANAPQPVQDQPLAPPSPSAGGGPVSPPEEKIEQSLAAAQEYMQTQQLDKATAILLRVIERVPQEVRGREMLGQVYFMQSQDAERRGDDAANRDLRRRAYEQYKAAVDIAPQSAGLQHSAGTMAMAAGENDAALAHFQAARRLDEGNPQYPLFEAQLLIAAQQYDQATAALLRVLELDRDEATAHASLAIIALEKSDFSGALLHINEARRIQPDDAMLRVQHAKILRRKGEPRQALELLVGLDDGQRGQEAVAFEIAAAYDLLEDPMAASRAWEQVYRSNPLAPRAWLAAVRAGEMLLKAGEREQAALWLQQAQLAAPHAPEVKSLEAALR